MPFNGSGGYGAPASTWNPAVTTTTINSTDWTALLADLSTALSMVIVKDGQTTPTANIPLGGFKLTGVGAATARTDAATIATIQDGTGIYVSTVGGTGDVITLTPSPAIAAYVSGQKFSFKASAANTTATTVAISGLAAKSITKNGTTALIANDIPNSSALVVIEYDGTQFQLLNTSISTAATVTTTIASGAVGTTQAQSDNSTKIATTAYADRVGTTITITPTNLIVNPNFTIDQINEGALYTVTGGGADVRTVDGWSGSGVAAPGVFKIRRLADPNHATQFCMEITCTTADAAIAATDAYYVYTAVEGKDIEDLQVGTANATSITIQFNSTMTPSGVYGISIANSATNRSYVGIFTQAVAGTEQTNSLTLVMDTTGTWLNTNGVGLYMRICLAAGSNFQAAAGAWNGANNLTTSAQANFMSVNTNIGYIGRIKLTKSTVTSAYDSPNISMELMRAQRYYAKTFGQGTVVAQNTGNINGCLTSNVLAATFLCNTRWSFPVDMRAAPTMVTYNPLAANANWINAGNTSGEVVSVLTATTSGVVINSSTSNSSEPVYIHATANARLS